MDSAVKDFLKKIAKAENRRYISIMQELTKAIITSDNEETKEITRV